ncbi:unnamed protein product [Mytilus coruscus]|uniref:Transposable element P transposase-like GTP-binding insertion domain-containing protein n=1 Tax=Mytilus coruscus TaxID=42192 RepID=A0A6J8BT33_MYTCO|nr:unnamed protein product [Mytilus coruscus]
MSDPPHLIKKLRNNIHSSGHKECHKRTVKLEGKEIIWEHFVSVFKRECKRVLPITKLNADAIYLNNFSKMRVNLAVHTLSNAVAKEMEENENEVTKATQKYIKVSSRIFEILNSEEPVKEETDPRIAELVEINEWFFQWSTELEHEFILPSEIQKHNISWQTIQDVHLTLSSFIDLVKYVCSQQFQMKYPTKPYIIPKRFNQDIVEGWFSHQRGCCGDNREPTVIQYGYNNTKLLSLKRAKSEVACNSYGKPNIKEVEGSKNSLKLVKTEKKPKLTWPINI